MKPFVLDSSMTSMGGVFYPTGHVFAIFPDEESVRQAHLALQAADHKGETAHASPQAMLEQIVGTLGTADAPLPSLGAEGDMVRRIADMAGTGHHGMLIHLNDDDSIETVVGAITADRTGPACYYRTFVIEDLIDTPAPAQSQSVVVGTLAAD